LRSALESLKRTRSIHSELTRRVDAAGKEVPWHVVAAILLQPESTIVRGEAEQLLQALADAYVKVEDFRAD
jgi:hypothetical protein